MRCLVRMLPMPAYMVAAALARLDLWGLGWSLALPAFGAPALAGTGERSA